MRHRTAACLLAASLALAGCSSSNEHSTHPKATPSATPTAATSKPTADAISACTDAIVAGKDSSAPECASLSPDDYLKALQAANKRGRDALQSALNGASSQP